MKLITFCVCFLISINSYCQNFSGTAVYTFTRKEYKSSEVQKKDEEKEAAKLLPVVKMALTSNNEKKSILEFNKKESIYKQENFLDAPNPKKIDFMGLDGNTDLTYKNLSANLLLIETELLGKKFLIRDSLVNYNWILTEETKKIGEFLCKKALTKKTLEHNEDSAEAIEMEIIAWYCPEIPIAQGPEGYQGLPGLILQIETDLGYLTCVKIALKPDSEVYISVPDKGKIVSREEYEKIAKEKIEEMKSGFKN